ncbi:MAG: adenylate/guanylate cyclase domain-containing protein [Anderseniella sp.]
MNEDLKKQYKGSWLERFVTLGTDGWYGHDKLGLVVANVTGFLATLSSLGFALTYSMHDYTSLAPLVWGNIVSALCTVITPLFHRFGRIAAALWLTIVVFFSVTWFTSLLGRDSGIMLNLIATAAVSFAILGMERVKLVAVICVAAATIIIVSWNMWPHPAPGIYDDPTFMRQTFATAIVSVMGIMFVVVFYAFFLAKQAQARLQELMKAMMPDAIADRLMANAGETIAQAHEHVVVLFSDIVGFVELSNRLGAVRVVAVLDDMFRGFDELATKYGVEKIKTIGDAYMAVAGVPSPVYRPEHAMVDFAKAMLKCAGEVGERHGIDLELRIGMASGPIMAGVVGKSKYSYDVWGAAVNLAARLESVGTPGCVVTTGDIKVVLQDEHKFLRTGTINLKGFGKVTIWSVDCTAAKNTGEA